MALRIRTVRDTAEYAAALGAIGHYFGGAFGSDEDNERFRRLLPARSPARRASTATEIVGGAGAFPFELSIPGGRLPCAGVTVVGVLPTHRRRGILNRMMRAQLADARERGEPIAALWASEETIYGQFGYGLATQDAMIRAPRVARSVASRAAGPHRDDPPRRSRRGACGLPADLRPGRAPLAGVRLPDEGLVGGAQARRPARAPPRRRRAEPRSCSSSTAGRPATPPTGSSSSSRTRRTRARSRCSRRSAIRR